MKQGSTFVLIVNLNIDLSRINSVIFTLKNKDVTLTKENWTYNNGKFELPFTQEETVQLQGRTRIEAQINFADGNVAKTQIKDIYIQETLATRIIEDNIATQEGKEVELVVEESVIFTSEDYSKLANKPKINGVVLLGDVSLDSLNIASKEFVEEEIAKFDFIKVVDVLPEVGLPNRVYYVPKTNGGKNDLFDEYAWINGDWEYYGTKVIEVDLTEYVKKTDYATVTDVSAKATSEKPITPLIIDYATMKALTDPKNIAWNDTQKALARATLGALANPSSFVSNNCVIVSMNGTISTIGYTNYHPFADQFLRLAPEYEGDEIMEVANGYILSNTPTRPYHTVNKKYVDDLVGSVQSILTELHTYAESLIGGES